MDSPPAAPPPSTPPGTSPRGTNEPGAPANRALTPSIPAQPLRRFPKPRALIPRLLDMCIRPESWALAARYPSRIALTTLLLAILIAATIFSATTMSRFSASLQSLADQFDAGKYPPLELSSDGALSAKGPMNHPIRIQLPSAAADASLPLVIDPTGKTTPDSLRQKGGVLISKTDVTFVAGETTLHNSIAKFLPSPWNPLADLELPAKGHTAVLSGPTLRHFLDDHTPALFVWGISVALCRAFCDALWAAAMLFFLPPLIMLAAAGPHLHPEAKTARLLLPRRAALRMAAALMVPLVLLDAILSAAGHPVASLLTQQGAIIFWFFAACALSIWTALLARHIYAPQKKTV